MVLRQANEQIADLFQLLGFVFDERGLNKVIVVLVREQGLGKFTKKALQN